MVNRRWFLIASFRAYSRTLLATVVTLLAYRTPRLPVSTAHGRPRHVHLVNHASHFPKSGQTVLSSHVQVRTTRPQLSLPLGFKPTLRITARLSVTPVFPFPPTILETVGITVLKESMERRLLQDRSSHQPLHFRRLFRLPQRHSPPNKLLR